jgi:hypothetical protein
MMPHVGPMIRQYNVFYSILFYSILFYSILFYSDAIKLPKSYPPPLPVVGRDYRLSNFWLAKEVNKELKKKLLHQFL